VEDLQSVKKQFLKKVPAVPKKKASGKATPRNNNKKSRKSPVKKRR
jgi:hypothetical protein